MLEDLQFILFLSCNDIFYKELNHVYLEQYLVLIALNTIF
jgi:hypothetical protein